MLTLIAAVALKDPLTLRKLTGLGLGIAGVALRIGWNPAALDVPPLTGRVVDLAGVERRIHRRHRHRLELEGPAGSLRELIEEVYAVSARSRSAEWRDVVDRRLEDVRLGEGRGYGGRSDREG